MKHLLHIGTFLSLFFMSLNGCSQNSERGPGYDFNLFKNTPNWKLAKAIINEDKDDLERLLKDSGININLQENIYGNTLLQLAVGNDKLVSTQILLLHKADINIPDFDGYTAIHEVTRYINLNKNGYDILKLLLEAGADPNKPSTDIKGNDTTNHYVPLMGGVKSLKATKLLLKYGADLYYKNHNQYPIWFNMLLLGSGPYENIFVARYIIIEKKLAIPNPVFYKINPIKPVNALEFIEKMNFNDDKEKQNIKKELITYLRQIKYPMFHTYKSDE